jgi:hypothetical protein
MKMTKLEKPSWIVEDLLDDTEYFFDSVAVKSQIVLHHTVSWKSDLKTMWSNDGSYVAVHFQVDKDGTVKQLMPFKSWAYHLGLKDKMNKHCNRVSIGIELVNEGAMRYQDKIWMWFPDVNGKFRLKFKRPDVDVYTLNTPYRGYTAFARYTDEQYIATARLVLYLHEALGIKLDYLYGFDFKREHYTYQGIIKHCNVRLDKTDLSPAWDEKVFINWIENLSKIKAEDIPPAKPTTITGDSK